MCKSETRRRIKRLTNTENLTIKEIAVFLYGGSSPQQVNNARGSMIKNGLPYLHKKLPHPQSFKDEVVQMAKTKPLCEVAQYYYGDNYKSHYHKISQWCQRAGVAIIPGRRGPTVRRPLGLQWNKKQIEMVRAAAQRYKKQVA